MAFFDDDLKRLKADHEGHDYNVRVPCEICNLVYRLEAAEEIASYFANHPDSAHWWPYAQNAIEAWRKSKGVDV